MRGPKPKYSIQLLDNQITELRQLINSRKAPQGKVRRAQIVMAAHEHPEWSNQQIAQAVGCSDRAVRTWRRRWVEGKGLEDLPRSGAPKRFSPRGAGTSNGPGLQFTSRKGEST